MKKREGKGKGNGTSSTSLFIYPATKQAIGCLLSGNQNDLHGKCTKSSRKRHTIRRSRRRLHRRLNFLRGMVEQCAKEAAKTKIINLIMNDQQHKEDGATQEEDVPTRKSTIPVLQLQKGMIFSATIVRRILKIGLKKETIQS